MGCNKLQCVAVPAENVSKVGVADANRLLQHGGEHRLKIAGRTADTSEVAVCCSSASSRSRVSRATCVWPRDERPRDTALGALPLFRFNPLRGRALAGPWPALGRLFIASTRMSAQGIVAGEEGTGHGDGVAARAPKTVGVAGAIC